VKRYRVVHRTTYEYGEAVVTSHNEARLSPRQLGRQAVGWSKVETDPIPDTLSCHRDYFGNEVTYFSVERPHHRLTVVAESRVDVAERSGAPTDPSSTTPWEAVVASVRRPASDFHTDAAQFVLDSTCVRGGSRLVDYALPSFAAGRPILDAVIDLNHRIHGDFWYDPNATTVSTPTEQVLRERRGVCQDFSHLMIGCLRSLGVPARYVSGYVGSEADGVGVNGATLVGTHASHAWVSAFCGEWGWIEVDPTNDLVVSDQHVVLGWGRDFEDVSPIRGVTLGGGRHEVSVEVLVEPASA